MTGFFGSLALVEWETLNWVLHVMGEHRLYMPGVTLEYAALVLLCCANEQYRAHTRNTTMLKKN